MQKQVGAIILAAGRGTRMQLTDQNKVTMLLGNKPLISYGVDLLKSLSVSPIIVVVGHAKQSVMDALSGEAVVYAEQQEQLGTAHAVLTALESLPDGVTDVFVLQGDDAMFYTKDILSSLQQTHEADGSGLTFLTITVADPTGLGRIIRNEQDEIHAIVEEKNATEEQKKVTEINPACYLFSVDFLKTYLHTVEKNTETGEYYLTSLIDMALRSNEKITAVHKENISWRGVNTKEELEQAQALFQTK